MYGTEFNLRTGQECNYSNIDGQATFGFADDFSGDRRSFSGRFLKVVPEMHAVGALVRKKDVAFHLIAASVKHHLNGVADFYIGLTVNGLKLDCGNKSFTLPPDVDDNFFFRHAEHVSLQNFAFTLCDMNVVVVQERLIILGVFQSWCLNIFVR